VKANGQMALKWKFCRADVSEKEYNNGNPVNPGCGYDSNGHRRYKNRGCNRNLK